MALTALVVGASGLVGGHCLELLLADPAFSRVATITRRRLPEAPKLEQHVLDFDRLEGYADYPATDVVFCALGSTIRKAGSQERFLEIDVEYPLRVGRRSLALGARHFLLVSAIGADSSSRIFYSRTKGELEDAIIALGYPAVTIARPSLLLGDRGEFRLGEEIAKRFAFLAPRKYRAVHGRDVARALVREAKTDRVGVRILENREL